MNEEYSEKNQISLEDKFKFSCHKGLACFNTCCADVNIFLTPYDVLRIRKSLWISSGEFLKTYTVTFLSENGLPLVLLRMMDDEMKTCPFVTPDGCSIHQNRPWSCRMYPIFPDSSKEEMFSIEEKPSCLGFQGDKEWTLKEWKKGQGIDIYDEMNEYYKGITMHDYFKEGKKLDPGMSKMIYMTCYDLDEFKKFLFKSKFFDIYDVENEVIEKIQENEDELLDFGYRWIRFNVFWEDTLRPKDKGIDKLLQTKKGELGL